MSRTDSLSYKEFLKKDHFSKKELIALAYGNLVHDPPGELTRLPSPPFLMVDRVTKIEREGNHGRILAEKDVVIDEWFFHCHFKGDPVQPGCLGVDAIWQLLGLYCVWNGSLGSGRALGCKQVLFEGQIRPHNKLIRYEVDVRRYTVVQGGKASLVIGSAKVLIDDELIYIIDDAKVGTFQGIAYTDYPLRSKNSIGGIMDKS